ncbi:MAG: sugar phosphate isomerase/epimerase [Bacteroidales bacterium]|nr:sugar phosphate isomerase/epimerase [Bacteroidales bacterium]MCF8406171.1 sugar phosphate isomerase/epimerase [Bacteroidales bacterium]
MLNRKLLTKIAGAIMLASSIFPGTSAFAQSTENSSDFSFELGVASYTLREFSTADAIDMTLRCGVNRMTFKSMHLALDADKETIEKTLELCSEKGISLYGAGVITMKTKAEVDQAFEYAKAAGLEMIIGVPYPEIIKYAEEKVKEYNIKIAIHNHGPGDDLYPSAEEIYNAIKDMDPRMGICLDIGHTARINRDPVQDFITYFDRILDVHIKDVAPTEKHPEGYTCIIGRGTIDIVSFLKTVVELDYSGTLGLEYEEEKNDPLPAMMESFGYVKGILATF